MTDPRKPRRRRWVWRALLLMAGLVGAQFALEWVLRTWDVLGVNHPTEIAQYRLQMWDFDIRGPDDADRLDGILFRHRPGGRKRFGSFEVAINSLGFRGPEVAAEKPEGTYRILVLGDSVAFGWGVDDDVTFLRRLERDLQQRGDGRSYEVLNTGHPMYDSMQELAMLRDHGLALDPDLVLLVFVINDIHPTRDVFEALLDADAGKLPEPSLGQRIYLW
jgi:hypothetical protein